LAAAHVLAGAFRAMALRHVRDSSRSPVHVGATTDTPAGDSPPRIQRRTSEVNLTSASEVHARTWWHVLESGRTSDNDRKLLKFQRETFQLQDEDLSKVVERLNSMFSDAQGRIFLGFTGIGKRTRDWICWDFSLDIEDLRAAEQGVEAKPGFIAGQGGGTAFPVHAQRLLPFHAQGFLGRPAGCRVGPSPVDFGRDHDVPHDCGPAGLRSCKAAQVRC